MERAHGLSRTRIYRIWIGMKARCNNPNSVPYPYYGAKGIRVCDEWEESGTGFLKFYNWAMAHGYDDTLTIDRINPRENYSPDNCRWADKYTQNVHLDRSKGPSGYYGISKHNNCNTWYGRIKVYGKCICTGSARTAKEAAYLRDKYIVEHGLQNRQNGVFVGNL